MFKLHSLMATNRGIAMSRTKLPVLIHAGLCAALLLLNAAVVMADTVKLRADAPERYVVARGDTLWDISARFLESPWRWPEVWNFNPQIENPHLIYPGDEVYLEYDTEGKPMLKVSRGVATMKLSPQIRSSRIDAPIATIPLNSIQQFLGQPRILSQEEIDNSGYIIASKDERLISGAGDRVYARGVVPGEDPKSRYSVLRIGKAYQNPGSKPDEILGYEAIHVADAQAIDYGDPTILTILDSSRETLVGDRLVPTLASELDKTFLPRPPATAIEGQIIAVIDGVSRIGQYQTVVVNRGEKDGLETGNVLAVYQSGRSVRDVHADKRGEDVQLPDQQTGLAMVYRTFDKVSYALIMEASLDMRVHDMVRNPK